ncbi:MAG: hypothetical protein D6814_03155 [Calditrichaeota bacterium]|nr:MAG: hypothetical protein D6814_03155 [Calditrichota bacterium]
MDRKLTGLVLLVALFLTVAGRGFSQGPYKILAVKGRSGLIRTPQDHQFKVGDRLLAVRMQNGQQIEVAQVRVALISKKYCGVKIIRPISDSKLQKGDYLVIQDLSFDHLRQQGRKSKTPQPTSQQFVEKFSARSEMPGKAAENPFTPRRSGMQQRADTSRGAHYSYADRPRRHPRSTSGPLPDVVLINQARPFLGPIVSVIVPVSSMSQFYASSPQFGLQLVTLLQGRTTLRIGLQAASLVLNPNYQRTLQAVGYQQKTYLANLTASLQPHFNDLFFFDLGAGYFRELDEQSFNNNDITTTVNALGTLGGIGIQLNVRDVQRLVILATGNIYFPKNKNQTFFSLAASWLFAL